MNFGQFLSGAGVVSEGIRQTEEAERVARENQLKIEEQNRFAAFKAKMAQDAARQRPQVLAPQFSQNVSPTPFNQSQQFPVDVVPAPAAPAATPAAVAPPIAPVNEGLGVRRMTPDEIARLRQDPYAVGSNQPAMTPSEIQRERDRLALLKAPTAALDVVQAPAAGAINLVTMAGEQVLNFGGRLVNAVTGADVAPTDLRGPRFSISPFYDKYVKAPEQKLDARVQDAQRFKELKDRAEAFKTAPTKPSKTALSYDNKVTPYDAVIQQSAIQYGIDPVVFKRLLGTESSFNPTAVSPRGESFGLGIAQIAAVHGLSREQMLDPNVAIPAGAQIFAGILKQAGGNYELALQRYKGASSEKGKAAMAGPIATILSGLIPSAQAAAPTAAAPTAAAPTAAAPIAAAPGAAAAPAAPTAAVVRTDADFYLANPQSIPYEYQRLTQAYQQVATQAQEQANLVTQQRNETARLAQMYMQSGTTTGIDTAMRMRDVINNYDIELLKLKQGVSNEQLKVTQGRIYLEGMQGLQDLALGNDPRRLASVWSQYAGVPIGIQPRSDGTFNIMVNGKKTKEGVTPAELSNNARLAFDQTYRQQQSAAGAEMNKFMSQERYKTMLKIQEGNASELAKMIREISVENTKGNNAQALEWAKANFGWDIKPTGAGDGTIIIRPPNGAPYIYNPSGKTIEIDGVKIQSNSAQLISGLPIPTQQRLNAVR